VGYFEYVKGYRLVQPHSNEIIIKRDAKFDEILLAYDPNSTFVPSSLPNVYINDPTLVSSFVMIVRMKIHLFLLTFLQ
jgi:hypothetical protein